MQPLFGLERDFAGEGVQVLDRRRHDLAQPRIRCVGHLRDHGLGHGGLGQVVHRYRSWTTVLRSNPTPAISTSTTSPGFIQTGGVR